MLTTVVTAEDKATPLWIDVSSATSEELHLLAQRYQLHPTEVADCLQPGHLPKHQRLGATTFIIIRAYDDRSQSSDTSVGAMTRKVALFLGDRFLISIHRQDPPYMAALREKYQRWEGPVFLQVVLLEILLAAVETYQAPLERIEKRNNAFAEALLKRPHAALWQDIFRTKNRLTIIQRMLWHSLDTVQKFVPSSSTNQPMCQDLRERIESLQFLAGHLLDDLNNLLHVQISLSSQKTNEVMRLLTLFSVFFLPLNFLVGVYGMNFKHMPELQWKYGYLGAWLLIGTISLVLYLWFRRRGWLGKRDP